MSAHGAETRPEARHRTYVGPSGSYDLGGALQFAMLALFGLREHHRVLDVGCGSLRAGRLLIPYLLPGHYFAVEPNRWLVKAAIGPEIHPGVIEERQPVIVDSADMTFPRCPEGFDFVIAASVFTHAPLRLIAECLAQAERHLAPRGLMLASYLPGDLDYTGDRWQYEPRMCVAYRTSTLVALAEAAGLVTLKLDVVPQMDQEWMLFARPTYTPPQVFQFRLMRRRAKSAG